MDRGLDRIVEEGEDELIDSSETIKVPETSSSSGNKVPQFPETSPSSGSMAPMSPETSSSSGSKPPQEPSPPTSFPRPPPLWDCPSGRWGPLTRSEVERVENFLRRQGSLGSANKEKENWRIISYWDEDCLAETRPLQTVFVEMTWHPLPFNILKMGRAALRYFEGKDEGRPLDRTCFNDLLGAFTVFVDFSKMPEIMRPDCIGYTEPFFALRVHAIQVLNDSIRKKLNPVILVARGGLSDILKAVLRHGDLLLIIGDFKTLNSNQAGESVIILNGNDVGQVDIVRVSSNETQVPVYLQEIVTPLTYPIYSFVYRSIQGDIINTDKFPGLKFQLDILDFLRLPSQNTFLEMAGMGAPLQKTDNVAEFYQLLTGDKVNNGDGWEENGSHVSSASGPIPNNPGPPPPPTKPKKRVTWTFDKPQTNEELTSHANPEPRQRMRRRNNEEEEDPPILARISTQLDKIIWLLQKQREEFRLLRLSTIILLLFFLACFGLLLMSFVFGTGGKNEGKGQALGRSCRRELVYFSGGRDGFFAWLFGWFVDIYQWFVHAIWGNQTAPNNYYDRPVII